MSGFFYCPPAVARNEAIATHANQRTLISTLPVGRTPLIHTLRFSDCLLQRLLRSSQRLGDEGFISKKFNNQS
jgi:hypothetical protein